jgi:hypothetical protein
MNRATELRLAKLERTAPRPASGFDAFTSDELLIQLLEGYSEILNRSEPAAELQEVRNWRQAIVDDITLTIELRCGLRPYPVPLASYAATVDQAAARWAAAGGKSAYVPALNHGDTGAGEYDGFDGPGLVAPDLMERRAALWEHPIVRKIAGLLRCGRFSMNKPSPLAAQSHRDSGANRSQIERWPPRDGSVREKPVVAKNAIAENPMPGITPAMPSGLPILGDQKTHSISRRGAPRRASAGQTLTG